MEKIIPSPIQSEPEKAQISIEGADDSVSRNPHREHTLTDENGHEVCLKKGAAEVEVTVEADRHAMTGRRVRVDSDSPSAETPGTVPDVAYRF